MIRTHGIVIEARELDTIADALEQRARQAKETADGIGDDIRLKSVFLDIEKRCRDLQTKLEDAGVL